MFKKILIANRAEIACRIMRSAQALGIKCVAVYSEADANSVHVQMADEAVCIGPPPATESYLNINKIIKAAIDTQAEAIHPGYGFLSENAEFCRSLKKHNIVFIGPDEPAIEKMGDKIRSKLLAKKAGVSTIPGHPDAINDANEAIKVANNIGYPVMLKASAGGGGKGMRLAYNDDEVKEGLASAINEARSSFGDERILIEKFITQPRHIEIQILADKYGNTLYLGERECSIQRRHQKVIEEAPSPHIDPETRKKMGEQAVKLAKAVNYCSAGTVEFIADNNKNFYFLEMNTRLQVEHPVTEYITNIDLVEWMLKIANNEKLTLKQNDIKLNGCAIESRIYAEDTKRGFLPSSGRLQILIPPNLNKNVRLDTGVTEGSDISVFYDPMIAKLITYGKDRKQAIENQRLALDQYLIQGVNHNIPFLANILDNKDFNDGNISTAFIENNYPNGLTEELITPKDASNHLAIAAIAYAKIEDHDSTPQQQRSLIAFTNDTKRSETELSIINSNTTDNQTTWLIQFPKNKKNITIKTNASKRQKLIKGTLNDKEFSAQVSEINNIFTVDHNGYQTQHYIFPHNIAPYFRLMLHKTSENSAQFLLSPMPGIVTAINVKKGDAVKIGQNIATIEAMKMENIIKSEKDGTIKQVFAKTGQSLMLDDKILAFE